MPKCMLSFKDRSRVPIKVSIICIILFDLKKTCGFMDIIFYFFAYLPLMFNMAFSYLKSEISLDMYRYSTR